MSLSMEVVMVHSTSLGKETIRMDGNLGLKDNASSPFQRFSCVIVLMYFWLKEEISKSTATYVANGLYQAQNGQNGLISDPHYERIIECRRRRQQVDLLLKYILRSTKETYACFVQLLRNSEDGHIAKSLDECIPTATQIQEFNQLQLFSLGKAVRPDCHCPRFIMQEGEFQMLCYMLNDVTTIETIADYFLSKFFFSVREHTNITSCPSKDEQRITSLLRTMTECSNKIRTALKEVLDLLKMGHVFTHLSETRRYPSDQEIMEDSNLPTKLLDGQVERSITEAFQAEPMDLRMKALKEIPFEVEEMETGSILIRLRPVSKNAWQIFEEKCYSGDIKYFIASVYDSEKLDEGRYEIDVKIYQELCSDEDDCVRAIIYLTDKFETEMGGEMAMKLHELQLSNDGKSDLKAGALKRKESYISRHMDLLCEEMDVSTSLLSYLSQHEIIDDSVKEMLKRIKGRAEKVRYLLTELSMESRAEDMLKRFIQKTDMCLFEDIESMENAKSPDKIRRSGKVSDETEMKDGRVPVNGSTQKHTTRRLFFSAVAILIVTKRGSIPNKAVKTDSSTKDNLQLWCSKLVDPVFYVKGKTCQSDVLPDMMKRLRSLPSEDEYCPICMPNPAPTSGPSGMPWGLDLRREEDLFTMVTKETELVHVISQKNIKSSKPHNDVHTNINKIASKVVEKNLLTRECEAENGQESTTERKDKQSKHIFVGNIDPLTPESTIRRYFELYGEVEKIDFPRNRWNGERRNFVFVHFAFQAPVTRIMGEKTHFIGMNEVRIQIAGSKAKQSHFKRRRRRRVDEPVLRNETTSSYHAGTSDDLDYVDFVTPWRYRDYSFGNYQSGYASYYVNYKYSQP